MTFYLQLFQLSRQNRSHLKRKRKNTKRSAAGLQKGPKLRKPPNYVGVAGKKSSRKG